MNKDTPFSAEYRVDKSTSPVAEANINNDTEQKDIAKTLESEYPLSKPKRVIIKARIIT